jgi:hypothetical protein
VANDSWQPREGARVRVKADPKAPPDEPPPPDGVWMVLSRSPFGPTHWWLYAVDDDARAWCTSHPGSHKSFAIDIPNRHMEPVNAVRL